jgi:hypothetical protein
MFVGYGIYYIQIFSDFLKFINIIFKFVKLKKSLKPRRQRPKRLSDNDITNCVSFRYLRDIAT